MRKAFDIGKKRRKKSICDTCAAATAAAIAAIEKVIKADNDDLQELLAGAGYAEPAEAVKGIDSLEDKLTDLLETQRNALTVTINGFNAVADIVPADRAVAKADVSADMVDYLYSLFGTDDFAQLTEAEMQAFYQDAIAYYGARYMADVDNGLVLGTYTTRTTEWIKGWSAQLASLMKLDTYKAIDGILTGALADGTGVQDVILQLQDAYAFSRERARRTAITEMLRAHSYAKNEAYIQSPAVEGKQWQHSGARKNKPRPHHVALNGVVVGKKEKFTISGPNGTFECDFPRDSVLPASEVVYCHCNVLPVVNADVLGLSLEERQALQAQAIADDNGEWEAELDAANKAKAGI